ncbi:hypothetical protein P7C73_g2400, partial [Tremellales sp. Uapishka_1]
MFASSSKTVLGSTVSAARSFSVRSFTQPNSKINMLTFSRDVEYIDATRRKENDPRRVAAGYDRIPVLPGQMRHYLHPLKQARYIPWKQGSDRYIVRTRVDKGGPTSDPLLSAPVSGTSSLSAAELDTPLIPTPQALLNTLHLLPDTVRFPLRTISRTSSTLHGSLTLSDIQDRLAKEFGLAPTQVEVEWSEGEAAGRMKELGKREVVVRVKEGGKEEIGLEVEVVRLED